MAPRGRSGRPGPSKFMLSVTGLRCTRPGSTVHVEGLDEVGDVVVNERGRTRLPGRARSRGLRAQRRERHRACAHPAWLTSRGVTSPQWSTTAATSSNGQRSAPLARTLSNFRPSVWPVHAAGRRRLRWRGCGSSPGGAGRRSTTRRRNRGGGVHAQARADRARRHRPRHRRDHRRRHLRAHRQRRRPEAGPGIVLSFVLAGVVCAFAALCYAELAAMVPVAGSAYTSRTPRWASSRRS